MILETEMLVEALRSRDGGKWLKVFIDLEIYSPIYWRESLEGEGVVVCTTDSHLTLKMSVEAFAEAMKAQKQQDKIGI